MNQSKFRGCILGLAIGDALGRPVQFAREIKEIAAASTPQGVTDLADGKFSDETQLAMCVSQALLESNGKFDLFMSKFSKSLIAWREIQEVPDFNRSPDLTVMSACDRLIAGFSWQESGIPDGFSNAAAPRSGPIGLYHIDNIPLIVEFAKSASDTTHNDAQSQVSAVAVALGVAFAAQDVPIGLWANEIMTPISGISPEFDSTLNYATSIIPYKIDAWQALSKEYIGEGYSPSEAVAGALFCCIRNQKSFKNAVLDAVNIRGPSDSIGCIVGAWMGAKLGLEGIPKEWIDKIEAKDALIQCADELFKVFEARKQIQADELKALEEFEQAEEQRELEKTKLSSVLKDLRNKIVESGEPLLNAEQIQQEKQERRG